MPRGVSVALPPQVGDRTASRLQDSPPGVGRAPSGAEGADWRAGPYACSCTETSFETPGSSIVTP